MGILSRFRDVMASNWNALLEQADNPEKQIDDYMRNLNQDLGQVKAETASVLAEESRAKRALDECRDEIRKYQQYAEKAILAGDDAQARKFLERKGPAAEKEARLQAAYDLAAENAARMNRMRDKLESDIGGLETRRAELKGKIAATRAQQRINAAGSPLGGGDPDAMFKAAEEKVNDAYNEAMAIAELRSGTQDDLEEQLARLDDDARTKPDRGASARPDAEDELAALKRKLGKQE